MQTVGHVKNTCHEAAPHTLLLFCLMKMQRNIKENNRQSVEKEKLLEWCTAGKCLYVEYQRRTGYRL